MKLRFHVRFWNSGGNCDVIVDYDYPFAIHSGASGLNNKRSSECKMALNG